MPGPTRALSCEAVEFGYRVMDWEHFRVFLAVARRGTYAAAVRPLGMVSATVRRHIESLEAYLGTPLFIRGPEGLTCTAAGRDLLPLAEAMEGAVSAAVRWAGSDAQAPRGVVKVSAAETVILEVLPPILARIQRAYPEIDLEIGSAETAEAVLLGHSDLAILPAAPRSDNLHLTPIGEARVAFYAHQDYLARHGTPATVADLPAHRIVGPIDEERRTTGAARMGLSAGDLRFVATCDGPMVQLAMIKAGLGLGLCLCAIGDTTPGLVRVAIPEAEYSLHPVVACHASQVDTLRIALVRDAIVEGLRAAVAPGGEAIAA